MKKSKESALVMGAVLLSTCTVMTFVYDPSVMGLINEAMQQVIPGFQVESKRLNATIQTIPNVIAI